MQKIIILSLGLFFCLNLTFAQGDKYSIKSKKAIKLFEEALMYYEVKNDAAAKELLTKAISQDSNFLEGHMLLANIYYDNRQYYEAIKSYKKAVSINSDFFPNNFYSLAKTQFKVGKYDDAIISLDNYFTYKSVNANITNDAQNIYKNCKFGSNAVKNPVPFNPVNLGKSINSTNKDYFPSITTDEQMILFTRLTSTDCIEKQEDFYVSYKDNNNIWKLAENIGAPVNQPCYNEGAPSLSADGRWLVFVVCELYGNYGTNRTGFGSCDLFLAKNDNGLWKDPINLGPSINTGYWETQPSLSADGRTLYFISNRPGGIGKQDIWVTKLNDKGQWSKPENLGKKINTPGTEQSVFIHADGQTLFFSSDGHTGMGGLDIYMSRMNADGTWGEPVNLGFPINTWNDEDGIIVNAEGETAFFSSDREGGVGDVDIYSFKLQDELKPILTTYFKGKVFDAETKKPLEAKFELIDLATGEVKIESYSSKTNGEFLVSLPYNRNYALNVSKDGYLFYSDNFELKDKSNKKSFVKDVPLNKLKNNIAIVLNNIFFETNKYDLLPESKVELNKLLKFLNDNKSIKIQLNGHTDNVGDDVSNQVLSENRAKAVVSYLIANGIDGSRLKYKGFGETSPIDTNETDEGRAKNRRTEFMILD